MDKKLSDIKEMFDDAYEKVSKLNEKLDNKLTEKEIEELINWCYENPSPYINNSHVTGESIKSIMKRVDKVDSK